MLPCVFRKISSAPVGVSCLSPTPLLPLLLYQSVEIDRSADKPLVAKWWGPIKERLAKEDTYVAEKNAREEVEIETLEKETALLEKELSEFSRFLEKQLLFLKDLELQRIDVALYIQKTQTHSITWYKSIINEIETNTAIQQKNPISRSRYIFVSKLRTRARALSDTSYCF